MGLKSGSRDSGLEDSSSDDIEEDTDEHGQETSVDEESSTGSMRERVSNHDPEPAETTGTEARPSRPTRQSLPYKIRREKVNEGREQVPFFLREDVIEAESDLKDALEKNLDESVYKSDYREAAMIVAQRRPELVAEVLREWGYDLDRV